MIKTKKENSPQSFLINFGKEVVRKVGEEAYGNLTRVGGKAVTGGKKALVDAIKRGFVSEG